MKVENGVSVNGLPSAPSAVQPTVLDAAGKSSIIVPGADFILTAHYARIGSNLILTSPDGETEFVIRDYFAAETPPDLFGDTGARIAGDLAARLSGPLAPGQYAQAGPAAQPDAIGRVESVTGVATATRADGTRVTLDKDAAIYAGDIIETGDGAGLGIVFIDKTTFAVGENARMVLDEMIFDPGNENVSSVTSLLQGAFVIITGEIGKLNPQAVVINTPAAQIGIRGTGMALDIQLAGADSTYAILFGAIAVFNSVAQTLLANPLDAVTFTSFNLPPGPVFPLSQAQFDSLFAATKTISDQLAPFAANLGEIAPGAGGNDPGSGGGDGGIDPNVSEGALSDPPGFSLPGPIDFLTIDPLPIIGAVLPPPLGSTEIFDGNNDELLAGSGGTVSTIGGDLSTIIGTDNGETLVGDDGVNVIFALGGDDTLIGAGGDDALFGGAGDDALFGGADIDILIGGAGDDVIDGGDGIDLAVFDGNFLDYTINIIIADDLNTGIPTTFYFVTDNRNQAPNDGTDSLVDVEFFAFADALYDTAINDLIAVNDLNAVDFAASFALISNSPPIFAVGELPDISGTADNDTLVGTEDNDLIAGLGGNDMIFGLGGDDELFGGLGDDTYFYTLGDGNDLISDIGGFDVFVVQGDSDSVQGARRVGDSLEIFFTDGGSVTAVDHFAGQQIEQISLEATGEVLNLRVLASEADGSDDVFVGGDGADNFDGLGGDDVLFGGGGDDTLTGGAGSDDLFGGAGSDTLTGGADQDFFNWLTPGELIFHGTDTLRLPGETGDLLTDFTSQTSAGFNADKLEFDSGAFGFAGSFNLTEGVDFHTIDALFDGTNSGNQTADPYFVYSTADDTLYYDNDPAAAGYSIVATVGPGGDAITAQDVEIFDPAAP